MSEIVANTPMRAIRAKCLDCCGGSAHEVKLCEIEGCPLYQYRMGKNPNIKREKREYTEEEKAALRDRLRKAREAAQNK